MTNFFIDVKIIFGDNMKKEEAKILSNDRVRVIMEYITLILEDTVKVSAKMKFNHAKINGQNMENNNKDNHIKQNSDNLNNVSPVFSFKDKNSDIHFDKKGTYVSFGPKESVIDNKGNFVGIQIHYKRKLLHILKLNCCASCFFIVM